MTMSIDYETLEILRTLPGSAGGDLLTEVVGIFLAMTPAKIQALKGAVARGDLEAVANDAHYVKGGAGNMGILKLAEISHHLELAARQGESQNLVKLMDDLFLEYTVIEPLLAELIEIEKAS